MNRKKTIIILLCIVFPLALAGAVYAAVSYGSEEDPLITKSYLEEVLRPEIQAEMDKEIDAAIAAIESAEKSADFAPLSLEAGDRLACKPGCEVLHRSGTAISGGSFADTTAGVDIGSGETLEINHLYMALGADSVLTAETEVTLMIKGAYTLN